MGITDFPLTNPDNLDSLTLSFERVGTDRVRFILKLSKVAWVGFGISAGDAVSMTAEGAGAGVVERFSVSSRTEVAFQNAGDVEDATCTYEDGSTIVAFTRDIAAIIGGQRALTPNLPQQVIYAYGNEGIMFMRYHDINRGGRNVVLLEEVGVDEEVLDEVATQNVALLISAIVVLIGLCVCIGLCITRLGNHRQLATTLSDNRPIASESADADSAPQEDIEKQLERTMTEDQLPTILGIKSRSNSYEDDGYLSKTYHAQSNATPSTGRGINPHDAVEGQYFDDHIFE